MFTPRFCCAKKILFCTPFCAAKTVSKYYVGFQKIKHRRVSEINLVDDPSVFFSLRFLPINSNLAL